MTFAVLLIGAIGGILRRPFVAIACLVNCEWGHLCLWAFRISVYVEAPRQRHPAGLWSWALELALGFGEVSDSKDYQLLTAMCPSQNPACRNRTEMVGCVVQAGNHGGLKVSDLGAWCMHGSDSSGAPASCKPSSPKRSSRVRLGVVL